MLSKGKYDIAAAKKEMSVLGGTREGKLGEATNTAFAIMSILDLATQAVEMDRINKLEGTTGFHLAIDGSMVVSNLQKFGDTFGVGASVNLNGDSFKLNNSGQWMDSRGNTLTQDKDGNWQIHTPTA